MFVCFRTLFHSLRQIFSIKTKVRSIGISRKPTTIPKYAQNCIIWVLLRILIRIILLVGPFYISSTYVYYSSRIKGNTSRLDLVRWPEKVYFTRQFFLFARSTLKVYDKRSKYYTYSSHCPLLWLMSRKLCIRIDNTSDFETITLFFNHYIHNWFPP